MEKLKTQGKNSRSGRIFPRLASQVILKKALITHTGTSPKNVLGALDDEMDEEELRSILSKGGSSHNLAAKIQAVFKKIMDNSMLEKRTY